MNPRFLTVDEVLYIHRRTIEEHGGSVELRDRGLLESAVAMPAARFAGAFLHSDVPAMAAAYLFHLCKNHPFVDGNKRIALAACDIFLELNGWELIATDPMLETLTLSTADSSITKDEVITFLRRHAVPPAIDS